EPRDGAVVTIAIEAARDAQLRFAVCVCRDIGDKRAVLDHLDEPGAEYRRRNPEDDILVGDLALEVLLNRSATADVAGAVHGPAHHEERMHAAIWRAVGILLEARLADRPKGLDERRPGVLGAESRRCRNLWINPRATAADCRLRVAPAATIEVEA